jgi:hypothetical protein
VKGRYELSLELQMLRGAHIQPDFHSVFYLFAVLSLIRIFQATSKNSAVYTRKSDRPFIQSVVLCRFAPLIHPRAIFFASHGKSLP